MHAVRAHSSVGLNGIQCVCSTEYLFVPVKPICNEFSIIVIFVFFIFIARFVAAHKFCGREKKNIYVTIGPSYVHAPITIATRAEDEIKNSNAFFHLILLVRTAEWKIVYLTRVRPQRGAENTEKKKNVGRPEISVSNAQALSCSDDTYVVILVLEYHTNFVHHSKYAPNQQPHTERWILLRRHTSTEKDCVRRGPGERRRERSTNGRKTH